MIDQEYLLKTYAGWLGKIIGIRLGAPIEGWTYKKIKAEYGEIKDYLVDYQDFAADDDSNGPLFFVRAIYDYAHELELITAQEMGNTWLNYAPENHSFFWWGGYGISTEHTAYANLKYGIEAPRSGSIEQNGKVCAEQIGGQIFSDCWGFVSPNNPSLAAQYAKKMASVSHDGEGVNGAMFVAGCISAAYSSTNIREIIEIGLSLLPADSEYVRVSRKVISFHEKDINKNWRECFKFIYQKFGYDKYAGNCHIIPNAAIMILSMLYGDGDYSNTLCICNMCGWDTDCNAGNVGAILGVLVGVENIEDKWIYPINDLLISSSLIGGLNISTIAKTTELFCYLGHKINDVELPHNLSSFPNYIMNFEIPKSTQAMRARANNNCKARIENVKLDELRCLKLSVDQVKSKTEIKWYHKTYYQPEDLHDSRYDPSFTPILYTGQKIQTVLKNTKNIEVYAKIYIKDINNKKTYFSNEILLEDKWTELSFKIPFIQNALIKEAGVVICNKENLTVNNKTLQVYMREFSFLGMPTFSIDFEHEKIEDFGLSKGSIHQEISQFTRKNGLWELEKEYLSGSCTDEGAVFTGYYYQKDYEYNCTVNPQKGFVHMVNFRVQGGIRSYSFGWWKKDTLGIVKTHNSSKVLVEKNLKLEYQRDYKFKIEVKGKNITTYINGEKVLLCEDEEFSYGQIGVMVKEGSHCHYKDILVKAI